jgi:hypothetical protein
MEVGPLTLFESESQYREKAAIWRIFSLLPLFGGLAGGHVWRWFAINIPMDLGTGGRFTGDLDILARLHDFPRSQEWLYKTWEVKVSLLCKDGTARSLKSGKMAKIMNQLRIHREFGSPDVSLLDTYICEAGFTGRNPFPPSCLNSSISSKLAELGGEHFGYQLLPFEHGKEGNDDVGLKAIHNVANRTQTTVNFLSSLVTRSHEPFSRLANRVSDFFEQAGDRPAKSFHQIVFCRVCRRLQLVRMRDEHTCPGCGSDLVTQS